MTADSAPARRPLVAVAYGPRSVGAVQLADAAADVCDLMWVVDASQPEVDEMASLLRRFGPVVDVGGMGIEQAAREVGRYRPDGMVTYFDAGMMSVACIARELGLPFVSPETALRLVDKLTQREALHLAGLAGPRFWAVPAGAGAAALAEISPQVHWPAVLKPRSETGSHNTFLARDQRHAELLLDQLGEDRADMLLEEYLSDDPNWSHSPYADYVSVESIVAHGRISHLAITGRFPQAETFRETGFFIPADLDEDDQQAVLDLAGDAIRALDVEFGCLHTEIKFTADGLRIIEVNGRIGFGVPAMLEQAAGFNLLATSLRVALGEHIAVDGPILCEGVGYRLFLQPPAIVGTVESIDGLSELAEHEGVASVQVHRGPGWQVDWREGNRTFVVGVIGAAKDHSQVQAVRRMLANDVAVSYASAEC
jgi:biotin carboxylase